MIIYLIKNLVNGKCYVGQTIQPVDTRWGQHVSQSLRGSKLILHCAIRKYGVESFERCILARAHTIDELNCLEEFHIKVQNTMVPNGYNLMPGGNNCERTVETRLKQSLAKSGKALSSEHRKHLSEARFGKPHPCCKWTDERKSKRSMLNKRLGIKPPSRLGTHQTEEHKQHLRESRLRNKLGK